MPDCVEYVGGKYQYLASGWVNGVGRYARGRVPAEAVWHFYIGYFLPLRER